MKERLKGIVSAILILLLILNPYKPQRTTMVIKMNTNNQKIKKPMIITLSVLAAIC